MYRIFVPKLAGFDYFIQYLRNRLCNSFGGVTQTQAKGYWVNDDGEIVFDDIILFDTIAELNDLNTNDIIHFCQEIKETLSQDCVLWVYFPLPTVNYV